MLYLAQVQEKDVAGQAALKLLAHRKSEHFWAVLKDEENLPLIDLRDSDFSYSTGRLVLVDISGDRLIQSIQDATSWVLEVVDQYLTSGVTPAFLHQEAQRAEQWRQSLTLQSQELGRRALEMEARRDQIQALEEKLKEEKRALELMEAELQTGTNTGSSN